MLLNRAKQANVLHAAGEWEKARDLFADAERRQREWRPTEPLLYSLQGYRYCDLLLSSGQAAEARDRAAQTIEIARRNNWVLDIALDTLTLGRAHLALALRRLATAQLRWTERATIYMRQPTGSTRSSKACVQLAQTTISHTASSPAPRSAAQSAIGMAQNAT